MIQGNTSLLQWFWSDFQDLVVSIHGKTSKKPSVWKRLMILNLYAAFGIPKDLMVMSVIRNHAFNVINPQTDECCPPIFACNGPVTSGFLNFSMSNLSLWLFGLLRMNWKGHHHEDMVTSYICSWKAPCPMDINSCLEPLPDYDVVNLLVMLLIWAVPSINRIL